MSTPILTQNQAQAGHRILADGVTQSNDTHKTGLNNNDLIIGPTGAGKTRGYVIPNILYDDESLIIADTKGNLRRQYGPYLMRRGYHIVDIDFVDCLHSPFGYDPLRFIHRDPKTKAIVEQDLFKVSAACCPVEALDRDPYWSQAAQMNLSALIALTFERFAPEDQNMATVCKLVERLGTPWLASLFKDIDDCNPESCAARLYRYATINVDAKKMVASVWGILVNAVKTMSFDGATHLFTAGDMVDFAHIGHEKTAVFVTVSDSDRSMDQLVNTFYTQALQELIYEADAQESSCLPVPVRIILDDFATNTVIPDFDKIITTIRSRGIAVSLVVQSLSQLRSLYTDSQAETIANNCDTWIYLGGTDLKTVDEVAKRIDKPLYKVLELGLDEPLLFIRGSRPRRVKKFNLEQDPIYRSIQSGISDMLCGDSQKVLPTDDIQMEAEEI